MSITAERKQELNEKMVESRQKMDVAMAEQRIAIESARGT